LKIAPKNSKNKIKLELGLKIPFEIKNSTPLVNNMIVLSNVGQVFAFGGQKIPIPKFSCKNQTRIESNFSIFLFIETCFYFLKEQNPKLSSYHKSKEPPKIINK
jgi:hypothetical protein